MTEISKSDQGADFLPPKAGRNFLGNPENAKNLLDQQALAGALETFQNVSERNETETGRPATGKIRGICSPDVPLSRDEVLNRLEVLAATKTGDPIPDFLSRSNGWADALSSLAARAAELLLMKDGLLPDLEVDRRLLGALQAAGRSPLGMPASVDTFKAMLAQAGLALVLA